MEPLTFGRPTATESRATAGGITPRARTRSAIALAAVAMAALYGPILARLVRTWWVDENYSHGFLILPIAAYLTWERRRRLARASRRPSNAGLPVVLGSLLVLLVGVFSAEVFVARVSIIGLGAGIVLYLFGWRHLQIVAFPLGFLLLMIPVPAILFNDIALPLQLLASRLGETVLSLAGVPVLREGNLITLAHARLEVAEACSGIRSLVSLFALAIVYGYFTDRRTWVRAALAVVAVPAAIAVNGLRVAGTGLLAQQFGGAAAQGFFHAFSGWLMFLAAFALLAAIQRLLAAAFPDRRTQTRRPETRTGEDHGRSIVSDSGLRTPDSGLRLVILACCLFAAAVAVDARSTPEPAAPRRALALLPSTIAGWQGHPGPPLDSETVNALGVDDFVNRVYSSDGQQPVALYIGYYQSQRAGDTVHSPLNCLPGAGWEAVSREEARLTVRETPDARALRPVVVNRLIVEKGAERDIIFYWYQSHGRVVANEYWGRLMLAVDAVRLNRTDGALVRTVTPVAGNDEAAEAAAERAAISFVEALFPLLGGFVPR